MPLKKKHKMLGLNDSNILKKNFKNFKKKAYILTLPRKLTAHPRSNPPPLFFQSEHFAKHEGQKCSPTAYPLNHFL